MHVDERHRLKMLWNEIKEAYSSIEGSRQLSLDLLVPDKEFLTSITTELHLYPRYFKSFTVYVCENYPDYEVLEGVLSAVEEFDDESAQIPELAREIFELVVEAAGMDVFSGISLWRKYVEFEVDRLEEFLSESKTLSADDVRSFQKHKQSVAGLFLRQLSLPLVGNDATMTQLQDVLSQYYSESDVNMIQPAILEKNMIEANRMLQERLPLEMKLFGEEYESLSRKHKLKVWEEYIALELKHGDSRRIRRLFERLLLQFPDDVEIWLVYVSYALNLLLDFSLATTIATRGLLIHPSDLLLRKSILFSINFQQIRLLGSGLIESSDQARAEVEKLRVGFTDGLTVGFTQAEDYLDFYFTFINCIRRILSEMISMKQRYRTDTLLAMRDEFLRGISELQQFLVNYYPQWKFAWETLSFYQSHHMVYLVCSLENRLMYLKEEGEDEDTRSEHREWSVSAFERRYEIWMSFLLQDTANYATYTDFLKQLIAIKDYDSAAYVYKLLQNEHGRLAVDKGFVVKDWMRFEENYRDMKQLISALSRYFPRLSEVIEKNSSVSSSGSAPISATTTEFAVATRTVSRKRDREKEGEEAEEDRKGSKSKRYKVRFEAELTKDAKNERIEHVAPSSYLLEENTPSDDHPQIDVQTSIVSIKNFPYAAPTQQIFDYVASLIPYQKIEMVFTKAGNSRGSVNVQFIDINDVKKLLAMKDSLVFEGRVLEVEINLPSLLNIDPQIFCTVFVNHLPQSATEEHIAQHFSSCGEIVKIKLARDKKTNCNKGSALIQFNSVESRNNALLLNKSSFSGEEISVLPSKFPIPLSETNSIPTTQSSEVSVKPIQKPPPKAVTAFAPRAVRKTRIQTEK